MGWGVSGLPRALGPSFVGPGEVGAVSGAACDRCWDWFEGGGGSMLSKRRARGPCKKDRKPCEHAMRAVLASSMREAAVRACLARGTKRYAEEVSARLEEP